jgi:hypothetical protein
MKGSKFLFLCASMVLMSASVAATPHQVILVDDVGATKVVKAVSLEYAIVNPIVNDLAQVDALVISANGYQVQRVDVSTLSPAKVFVINFESTADRVGRYYRAENLTGYLPPADIVKRAKKIYLEQCRIKQC